MGPTREHRGLYILSQLNFMTDIIGRVKDIALANIIRIICTSPKRIMEGIFTLLDSAEQGRFFQLNEFWKDLILLGQSIILILFWVLIRYRL